MARQAAKRAAKKSSARKGAAKKSSAKRSSSSRRGASVKSARRLPTAKKGGRGSSRRQSQSKDLKELFHETLKDVYHAEKQLVRALPKMAKAAQASELRRAIENHLAETQNQVQRLEQVFQILGERVSAKPCHGMMGLVEEGEEAIKDFKGTDPADAGIIGAAQAVEHYEIARYGTLKTWASQLGMDDAAQLLEETLAEEKKADELLTQIAESGVNQRAQ